MQPANVHSPERTRRRTKGTGAVIRRQNGRYEARYRGKSATARTEREAEALLAQLIAGTYQPRRRRVLHQELTGAPPTLNQFAERYLAHCRLQGVSEETLSGSYRPSLARFRDTLGPLPLEAITPEDVSAALQVILAVRSPGTVRMARAVLKRCLGLAEEWELIDRNPVRGRPPRLAPKPPPRISPARARAVLAAVAESRAAPAVTLGLCLGLRIGEVLGLRWEDIEEDCLVVRGQTLRTQAYKPRTKSGAEREIPLIAPVREALRQARRRQTEDQLVRGQGYERTGFVVTGPSGRPLSRSYLRLVLTTHLEAAGIPRATFHSLRHMTATLLHDLGVSEEVRRSILGHASAEVHRGYVHIDATAQREAMARLERALA